MSRLNLLFLVPGAILALLAGAAAYLAVSMARGSATVAETTPVLVASGEIAPGTLLDSTALATLISVVRMPATEAPADGFANGATVEGRTVVALVPPGEPLRLSSLAPVAMLLPSPSPGSSGSVQGTPGPTAVPGQLVASLIPQGLVAVVLPVNEQVSVGGAVRPGDHVDFIASVPVRQADGSSKVVTQTLLQDVAIIATGGQTSAQGNGPRPAFNTLTLALNPNDAVVVQHLLSSNFRIALSLRAPGDRSPGSTVPPVSTEDIIKRFNLGEGATP